MEFKQVSPSPCGKLYDDARDPGSLKTMQPFQNGVVNHFGVTPLLPTGEGNVFTPVCHSVYR